MINIHARLLLILLCIFGFSLPAALFADVAADQAYQRAFAAKYQQALLELSHIVRFGVRAD